ncbi:MAG: hypothetical protein JXX14_17795 [Deltaproteobacteria bacterium]|nr:hypothetical protein [Deltaproteobacteria bacterium]
MTVATQYQFYQMEQDAKAMESTDVDAAKQAYGKLALLWKESSNTPLAQATFLRLARKAGQDKQALLTSANAYPKAYFQLDAFRHSVAWIHYDVVQAGLKMENIELSLSALAEMLLLVEGKENDAYLVNALGACLSKGVKLLKKASVKSGFGASTEVSALRSSLGSQFDKIAALIDWRTGRQQLSNGEVFCFAVRTLGILFKDAVLLDKYMGMAAKHIPHNEWFAEAYIFAAQIDGRIEEAMARGQRMAMRLPQSEAVAIRRSEIAVASEQLATAHKLLWDVAATSRSPWIWSKLACVQEKMGKLAAAADALGCGLGFQIKAAPGKVWRLHHDRSRLLMALGNVDEAAVEAWLGKDARAQMGWALNAAQIEFVNAYSDVFSNVFGKLDSMDRSKVRSDQITIYRRLLSKQHDAQYATAVVVFYSSQKQFGLVKLESGESAFLPGTLQGVSSLNEGNRVQVICIPSFDAKKNKMGLRVVRLRMA